MKGTEVIIPDNDQAGDGGSSLAERFGGLTIGGSNGNIGGQSGVLPDPSEGD